MTFSGFNFWTDGNVQYMWEITNWLVSQGAPLLLVLFAGYVMYLVMKFARNIEPQQNDPEEYGEYEED